MTLRLEMEPKLINKRASFFPNGLISYDGVTISNLSEHLNRYGLLPSLNKSISFQIGPNGLVSPKEVQTLEMRSLSNSLRVTMLPERVDVYSVEDIEIMSFIETANNVASEIIQVCSNIFNRVALGAVYFWDVPNDKMKSIYSTIVHPTKDENPIEWSIRKVNRKSLIKDTHQVMYNEVSTLSRSIISIPQTQTLNGLTLELDINTVVGSVPHDVMALKDKFFELAKDIIDNSIIEYSKIISQDEFSANE